MFRIVDKRPLGENVALYEVEAPRVARRHRAGQFVMVRPHVRSERIPLTIADADRERGTITLVVQSVGKTTYEMAEAFSRDDSFSDVAGPLGNPTHIAIPEKGRRRPVPIEGAYEKLPVEIVIEAIGNGPNPLIPKTTAGLATTRHGTLVVDEATMMTTRKGVFAGGDIVAGASTVILAMGHGRKAASAIDAYLRSERGVNAEAELAHR